MKRMIALMRAVMMSASVFAGCGGGSELNKVMQDINSSYNLELKTIESKDDLAKYYSIKPESIKQFAAEIDSNANAPVEIIFIEATDDAAAEEVQKALTARYNSILSQYASYTPEKLDMVKECEVTKEGKYVTLVVADNAAEIRQKFSDNVK